MEKANRENTGPTPPDTPIDRRDVN